MMNNDQVDRSIQSIGMKCFVKHFYSFTDNTINNSDLIELLMKREGWKEKGCRTRVSQARRLIKEKKSLYVLEKIIQSERIQKSIKDKANKILQDL